MWLKTRKEAELYGVICVIIPAIIGTLLSGLFLKWKNSPAALLTFQNSISLILLSAAISTKCGNQMVEGLFEEKSGEIVPLRKPLGMFIAEKTPSVGLIPIYYFNGPSGSNGHGHK